jgi:pimeloyl-ACP methyl ester carboxylesterase
VGDAVTVEAFAIAVAQSELDDLHQRLDRTRWPEEVPGGGWDQGVPLAYLRELSDHWRHRYDWRAHEARLNALAQFTTRIDGTRIHFVHVRSPEPAALPLVILHGWPGSIVELAGLIGPLADPRAHGGDPARAFHVVAPSLPGYGFSGPTPDRGWGVRRIAAAMAELMGRLGYRRFGAHGGDWGAAIARELGVLAPDRVLGAHITMLSSAAASRRDADADADADPQDERQQRSLAAAARYRRDLSGYAILQSTRPQTLSYALTDSPVGQLLLADADRGVLGAAVLGDRARAGRVGERPGVVDGADRRRGLPPGPVGPHPAHRAARQPDRPLDRDGARRSLPGAGGARAPAGRHPRLLRRSALNGTRKARRRQVTRLPPPRNDSTNSGLAESSAGVPSIRSWPPPRT